MALERPRRPKWSDVPLRRKILIVMSVPLVALIASTASFLLALGQENEAEDAARHAAMIRQGSTDVEAALEALNGAIWGQAFGFATSSFGQAKTQLGENVDRLRTLVGDDAAAEASLRTFEERVATSTELSQRFAQQILDSGRIPTLTPDVLEEAGALAQSPAVILQEISATAELAVADLTAQAERARTRVLVTLIAGSVVGVLGGLVLMTLAVNGIVGRIHRVRDNAGRLAAGESLLPLEQAADEVGDLASELDHAAALLAEREYAMRTAIDEADRANRAKSEFLSRMSHELRTPLNSILGFGQVLEMSAPPGETADDVRQILRGGRHLLALIDEVLDISRIEAGEFTCSIEPVNVHDVLAEVVALARPLAEQREVRIAVQPVTDVWVLADRQRLKQVLLNLVANGVKFNRVGGSVLLAIESDGEVIKIAVRDTGRGIAAEDLGRLFVPFERLDAIAHGIEGTGLGLAVSRRLVDAMGGTITVTSELGVGSAFVVGLPRAARVPASAPVAVAVAELQDADAGVQPVVLYVEDNIANFSLIQRILAGRNIRLISSMKGTLGLELAHEHLPQAILLDLHLPDISGEEVLERLRSDPLTAAIPVIVISADAMPRTIARTTGVSAFLTKPLDVQKFLAALDGALAERSIA